MKAFTVNLKKLINAVSPIPVGVVTTGIKVTPDEAGEVIHIGQVGRGTWATKCGIGIGQKTPTITNGLLIDGFGISVGNNRSGVIKSTKKSNDIIVRVVCETERNIGLKFEGDVINGGATVLNTGSGRGAKNEVFDDILITIKPHCGIILNKNGEPNLVIANSGGEYGSAMPVVCSVMEFEENFIPHITAKPLVKTEIVETKQPVYSGSEMVTTEATTSTATNPAPTPAPKKFRGSIKVDFGTVSGEAGETGIRFVKSERRHYRANRIGTGGKPEKVSAN